MGWATGGLEPPWVPVSPLTPPCHPLILKSLATSCVCQMVHHKLCCYPNDLHWNQLYLSDFLIFAAPNLFCQEGTLPTPYPCPCPCPCPWNLVHATAYETQHCHTRIATNSRNRVLPRATNGDTAIHHGANQWNLYSQYYFKFTLELYWFDYWGLKFEREFLRQLKNQIHHNLK